MISSPLIGMDFPNYSQWSTVRVKGAFKRLNQMFGFRAELRGGMGDGRLQEWEEKGEARGHFGQDTATGEGSVQGNG